MGSTDSSILIALQKQWERQEQVAREANKIKRQKEERKRMKEEQEQRKEERKKAKKRKCSNAIGSTNHSKRSPDLMAVHHTTVLIG